MARINRASCSGASPPRDYRHWPAWAIAVAGSRARSSGRFRNTRPAFVASPVLAGAVVGVVLTLAGAEPQALRQRRSLSLQFGVGVEGRLVFPQFEQGQLVGIGNALEHLELFATGILTRDFATCLHRLREFGALAARCMERDDEPDRHGISSRA